MVIYYSCDLKENINEFKKNTSEYNILKTSFKYLKDHKIKNINIITFYRRHFLWKISKIFGMEVAESLCKKGIYRYKNNYVKLINEKTTPEFDTLYIMAYLLSFESLEILIKKYPSKIFLWIPNDETELNRLKEKYETYNVYSEYK
ncbi:hypothetical protein [Fusobacterium sp. PH5-44]|uniref:hypothetical protein n=1 Tax=unclassified Fusobacterium TaxID=2648384 RepID=UPI003D1AFBF4